MTQAINRTYATAIASSGLLFFTMKSEAHHFFLHAPELATWDLAVGTRYTLPFQTAHRIASILRLREKECVTLFHKDIAITLELTSILSGKKSTVTGTVIAVETKQPLQPHITLMCGIVKNTTFEEICFSATQLGVARIIPVLTEKSYTKPYSEKDFAKFAAHCVAAAEQSKQIFLPTLEKPLKLADVLKTFSSNQATRYLFEADGSSLRSVVQKETPSELIVAFGPEGGFSTQEQQFLQGNGFEKLKLCTSILRTQDAIEVGIGALRSLL